MAFDALLAMTASIAIITLSGSLDAGSAPRFKEVIEKAAVQSPSRLVLLMKDLEFLASAGLRVLIFAKQILNFPSDKGDQGG